MYSPDVEAPKDDLTLDDGAALVIPLRHTKYPGSPAATRFLVSNRVASASSVPYPREI